jgi:hypothetical protein
MIGPEPVKPLSSWIGVWTTVRAMSSLAGACIFGRLASMMSPSLGHETRLSLGPSVDRADECRQDFDIQAAAADDATLATTRQTSFRPSKVRMHSSRFVEYHPSTNLTRCNELPKKWDASRFQ